MNVKENKTKDFGEKYSKYGKSEKYWEHREELNNQFSPTTHMQLTIWEQFEIISKIEKLIPIEIAFDIFSTVQSARHDLWIEYFNINNTITRYSPNTKDKLFGDIRFGDFKNLLKNEMNVIINESDQDKKTPDILLLSSDGAVILGDIAVSRVASTIEKDKNIKYKRIEEILKNNGLNVVHINCIIDEDLRNISSQLQKFRSFLIINEFEINKAKHYHSLANDIMNICLSRSVDNSLVRRKIEEHREIKEKGRITFELNEPTIDGFNEFDIPTCTIEELANAIKLETDKSYKDYFDKDYKDTELSFNKLYDSYNNRQSHKAKPTVQAVYNANDINNTTGLDLLEQYVKDLLISNYSVSRDYFLNLLPTLNQIKYMKLASRDKKLNLSDNVIFDKYKDNKVFGQWQFTRLIQNGNNAPTAKLHDHLLKGKKNKNEKNEPTCISPNDFAECITKIESMIKYLGSESSKPTVIKTEWQNATTFEYNNTVDTKRVHDIINKTNGMQLAASLSGLYQRLIHLKSKLSQKDNVYIPPGGEFIVIIPNSHQPFTDSKCDVPFITITRLNKDDESTHLEFEYYHDTDNYTYYISKLNRLDIEKMRNWDQSEYNLILSTTALINTWDTNMKVSDIRRIVGLSTILKLDVHQKTSEFLELLKYISYMPMADASNLSKLVLDKMNIMLKTALDVWILTKSREFMYRLSTEVVSYKSKLFSVRGRIHNSSYGLNMELPSFIIDYNHTKLSSYIEETSFLFIIRGKKLYGSQFMQKSIIATVERNIEYEEEIRKYGNWVTTGAGDIKDYPFKSKYAFSKDAILIGIRILEKVCPINRDSTLKKLYNSDYDKYLHYPATLRGSTKETHDRQNRVDLHSTALDECLKYYKNINYDENLSKPKHLAIKYIKPEYIPQYSMSEKEQRGSGRPIATPTLISKVGNLMIEKPEQAIGTSIKNNIIVSGKHKIVAQERAYKDLLNFAIQKSKKVIVQCTEDQSKFSEEDNTRKFLVYIKNNTMMPMNVRQMQYHCMKKMENREHLIKVMPKILYENPEYAKYINNDKNGVKVNIGWPQGMLNHISTHLHSMADYLSTELYNIAYPNDNIITEGLVHSDDSWYTIACNDIEHFYRYCVFRIKVKRLFCLKMNEKKLYASGAVGEMVSNFNCNGEMIVPIIKIVSNCSNNLLFQNWIIDSTAQISSIQQAYKNGATIGVLISMLTCLKDQLYKCYNKTMNSDLSRLPIDLGGFPSKSAFELATTGLACHYQEIYESIKMNPDTEISKAIINCIKISKLKNKLGKDEAIKRCRVFGEVTTIDNDDTISYESVVIPEKAEVFSAIRHIMPKSNKITRTLNDIMSLPFETDGLEILDSRPDRLSNALGHLKSNGNKLLYQYATEHYTARKRRMAVNQAIKASGKTMRLLNFEPMNIGEILSLLLRIIVKGTFSPLNDIKVAFNDCTGTVQLTECIVHNSDYYITNSNKTRVVNKQPRKLDIFTPTTEIKDCLFYILSVKKNNPDFLKKLTASANMDDIKKDSDLLLSRFKVYFDYYTVETSVNLIMIKHIETLQIKMYIQPELRNFEPIEYYCDLYGKTLNNIINYEVVISSFTKLVSRDDEYRVNTLYTIEVLNSIYDNKFRIHQLMYEGINYNKYDYLSSVRTDELTNNTLLKYAMLYYLYFNIDRHLRNYDDQITFYGHWLQPQSMRGGKYEGKFSYRVIYREKIIIIEGNVGNLTITTNTTNTQTIVEAMQYFVNNNFPSFSYYSPHNWSVGIFWSTAIPITMNKLVSYNNITTEIVNCPNAIGVDIIIKEMANIDFIRTSTSVENYVITENLRVLSKKVNNYKGRIETVRVKTVKQDMSCPFITKVKFYPDFICGIANNLLVKNNLIINLTLGRPHNSSTKSLIDLILSSDCYKNDLHSFHFFKNIINILKPRKFESTILNLNTELCVEEVEVIEIGSTKVVTIHDLSEQIEPTTIEHIDANYLYCGDSRTGKLYKHNDIFRSLCKMVSYDYKITSIEDVFRHLRSNNEFLQSLLHISKSYTAYELQEMDEIFQSDDELHECNIFVLANNLDRAAVYQYITKNVINKLWKSKDYKNKLGNIPKIKINHILEYITERIMDIENKIDTVVDELLDDDD